MSMTIQKQFALPWQVDNNVVVLSTICWQYYISAKLTEVSYDENIYRLHVLNQTNADCFHILVCTPRERSIMYVR